MAGCHVSREVAHIRRLNGRGSPSPPQLVGAENFRRRRSVGTRRRRESLRTFWRLIKTHESCTLNTTGVEHAYRRLRVRFAITCTIGEQGMTS